MASTGVGIARTRNLINALLLDVVQSYTFENNEEREEEMGMQQRSHHGMRLATGETVGRGEAVEEKKTTTMIQVSSESLTILQSFLLVTISTEGTWSRAAHGLGDGDTFSVVSYVVSMLDLYLLGRIDMILIKPTVSDSFQGYQHCEIRVISADPIGNYLDFILDSLRVWIDEVGTDKVVKLADLLEYRVKDRLFSFSRSKYDGYTRFQLPNDDQTRCGLRPAIEDLVKRGVLDARPLGFFSRFWNWMYYAYVPIKLDVKTALIDALRSLIVSPDYVATSSNQHLSTLVALLDIVSRHQIWQLFVKQKVLLSEEEFSKHKDRIILIAKRNSKLRIFQNVDSESEGLLLNKHTHKSKHL